MVVFTCNSCGDSLQKPKVEKHYNTVCRSAKSLSCVDCFKDFRDEEYVAHTKCVTEEERYAAKGSIPNGVVKKGEVKQQSWTDLLQSITNTTPNATANQRRIFEVISNSVNVPRKKNKFINFIKSSTGSRVNTADIEAVWSFIEKAKTENKKSEDNQTETPLEMNNAEEPKPKKQKKSKVVDSEPNKQLLTLDKPEESNETTEANDIQVNKKKDKKSKKKSKELVIQSENTEIESSDHTTKKKRKSKSSEPIDNKKPKLDEENLVEETKIKPEDSKTQFSFVNQIVEVLESKKEGISIENLQKKVLKAFYKQFGTEPSQKAAKKFNKKLKKVSGIEITENHVKLINS